MPIAECRMKANSIGNRNRQSEIEAKHMGQKVNPTGFRVGITEDWKSRWYAPKAAYGNFLVEDHKVRRYIDQKLNRKPPFAAVSDIMIERTREEVTITLKTARPGLVIGPKGAEVDKLREELEDLIKRKVAPIKVIEIKNPDLNAQLVAEAIAEQLKKRASFRRVLKQRMDATMQAGAKGIRISVSGRLGGAEIARQEKATTGSVPLTTLQADVNYGYAIAFTTYGTIGVKTWIYRGMYGEEVQDTDVRPGGGPRRGRR
jgi:small subunit ribosomal protein S3